MVRSKETFEQWSTKKKSRPPSSPIASEGTRRAMRSRSQKEDICEPSAMKRTPLKASLVQIPASATETVRSVGNDEFIASRGRLRSTSLSEGEKEGTRKTLHSRREDVPASIGSDSERHDIRKRGRKGKTSRTVHGGNAVDQGVSSNDEEQRENSRQKSRSGKVLRQTLTSETEVISETRGRGCVRTLSQRRSRSTSSASTERSEGALALNRQGVRKRRTLSEEEHGRERDSRRQSRTVGSRSPRATERDVLRRREVHGEPRRRHRSRSSDSGSGSRQHLQRRSHLAFEEGRSLHVNSKSNPRGHARSHVMEREADANESRGSPAQYKGDGIDVDAVDSMDETEVEEKPLVEVKSETASRKDRRDRQKDRERRVRKREKEGMKAYYLHVNRNGRPYGDGVIAWKLDLNKLARGLDPSVMDVREQPPTEMSTLRRRLRQNFEYSQPVDPIYILQLVGRAITQWRNSLWKKMDVGGKRPKGFDRDVWEKLERTRICPSHTEKSERMKHANRCRITLGRTGPRGEEGIREFLRLKKGSSPDYDEVFAEMHRDKGYGGRSHVKKPSPKLKELMEANADDESAEDCIAGDVDVSLERGSDPIAMKGSSSKAAPVEGVYLKGLHSKIAELQAQVAEICGRPHADGKHSFTGEAVGYEGDKSPGGLEVAVRKESVGGVEETP